jgi:hypothetical protein
MLFLFVFALAGRSLFAGKLPESSRSNFDSLFISFVTTFQLVTGENWNDILYETMEFNPAIGAIFCILVYTLGTLVVLNIFLAILLETFSNVKDDADSYYDKLDSQTSFQSSVKEAWQKFITEAKVLYSRLVPKDNKEETEEEADADEKEDEEETEEQTKARERDLFFSTKATAQRGSFKRVTLASKSKWVGKSCTS